MECLTAQELISDALDRTPVDAEQLAQAKQHCQGCPTCSVFVRTLLLVRNSVPAPPEDLADRVMVAIRAEDAAAKQRAATARAAELRAAAMAEAAEAASATDVTNQDSSSATPEAARIAPIAVLRRWAAGRSRQGLVLWASAAVVFVAVLGITASAGVRMITTPPNTDTVASDSLAMSAKSSDQLAAPQTAESAAGVGAAAVAAAGSYVTAQGVVFVLSGPSSVATSGLEATTSVNSGFGSDPARNAPTYATADPDRLYIYDDATKQLLVFNRVVRTYAGVRYHLVSAALSNYGQWPTLPENIAAPTSADGSPTFVPLAADPSGTPVYALAGSDLRTGIAVAPGSSPGDPAAGNPNWTWWTPAP